MNHKRVTVRAPAKINWTLRVLGRRPDGFHEIESLVSAVSLFDELVFTDRSDGQLSLTCGAADLPTDFGNLVVRTAERLRERSGCRGGMACRLEKGIPVGGGLGGGSSDAAATLVALNRLWALDWPIDRLAPIAAELGSDVPFFLHGGTAMIRGRGERIEPASLPWAGWIVLLMPGFGVSTAEVYHAWTPGEIAPAAETGQHPAAEEWMRRTFNMLEQPATAVCPQLAELLRGAEACARRPVRLSGSGSTMFTVFDVEADAQAFARDASEALAIKIVVVRPIEAGGMTVVE